MRTVASVRRLLATLVVGAVAVLPPGSTHAAGRPFPDRIDLPPGFRPEGIVVGQGATFYVGSISTGALYRGDLRTGEGDVITPATPGTAAIGLAVDERERVFVAGGPTGKARVVDGRTGAVLATYQLTTASTFVNDVAVTKTDAWFTDSVNPVLYRVPLDLGPAQAVPLTGDLVYQQGFNVNGIDTTDDGGTLVLVQSNTGRLFTTDPATGVTRAVDLGGATVQTGDGILLAGRTLQVVQNQRNQVAVVTLSPDLASGTVTEVRTDPAFDIPTTVDRAGDRLYLVNARFTTPPTAATEYWITAIPTH